MSEITYHAEQTVEMYHSSKFIKTDPTRYQGLKSQAISYSVFDRKDTILILCGASIHDANRLKEKGNEAKEKLSMLSGIEFR